MTAALPVISALGVEACPLPTAILSNQTGYPSFFCDDFTDRLAPYIAEWKKRKVQFDGILTGFLMSDAQADSIIQFVQDFKRKETIYVCDPVMADEGQLYGTYTPALCKKMTELARLADVITPNLTELCILTGVSFSEIEAKEGKADYLPTIETLAKTLLGDCLHTVVVTGIVHGAEIRTMAVTKTQTTQAVSKRFGGSYSGTGDLFSSVLSAALVRGETVDVAMHLAVRFLESAIEDSFKNGNDRNDGINFQRFMGMLTEREK